VGKSIREIKKDLKFIKHKQRAINTYIESQTSYLHRIRWLNDQQNKRDVGGANKVLNALNSDINVGRLQRLEEYYLGEINKLDDELDRMAILKFYLQGKSMQRTANEMHYSIDGLKSRLSRALTRLSKV